MALEIGVDGGAGCSVAPAHLAENVLYRFDSESMTAMRHAIEDLALEEANGRFLSVFGSAAAFEPHRERHTCLAATIEAVDIVLPAPRPRKVPHARWIRDDQGA